MIKGNSPSVLVLNGSGASPLFQRFTRCATRYLNSPPSARSTEGGWAELGIRIPLKHRFASSIGLVGRIL